MNNSVTVKIKTAYGVERVYPVCDNAKLFAQIAGTDTLSLDNIKRIKALGFAIHQEQQQSVLAGLTE